ncbi:MAG: hypothetical protein JSS60_00070 [Verrucomicrobia bacterium]|nr:hypothetical protein [Verrucomicrobiota bacterium]
MKYYLAEACQNTFVLFDHREGGVDKKTLQQAHRCLIEEDRDDALLITKSAVVSGALQVEMLVLGLDGTLGEFCGNGARAVAAYLFASSSCETIILTSKSGSVCQMQKEKPGTFAIAMPFPSFKTDTPFIADTERFRRECGLAYVEMLEPHLLANQPMNDEELMALGRNLNRQKDLFPYGINVNAWHQVEEGVLFVKTYERGVQRLTRSCGTGSASCAAFYGRDSAVITPGGELKITFGRHALTLSGPAQFEPIAKDTNYARE